MPGFKQYGRTPRNMTIEESFANGMRFTETPLLEGFCKAMVNFDFKDDGEVLIPRNGYQSLHLETLGYHPLPYSIHHTAQGAVYNTVTKEDLSRRYVLLDSQTSIEGWFDFSDALILLENEFNTTFNDSTHKSFSELALHLKSEVINQVVVFERFRIRRMPRSRTQLLHNVSLTNPLLFRGMDFLPVYTMLNNVAIIPVEYTPPGGQPKLGYAKLKILTDDGDVVYAEMEYLEPQAISPTEAVNYGYNMLSPTPYAFTDSISAALAAGQINMEGILPYTSEACTTLKFNAKVGEKITFRMIGQYPNTTSTYKLRWEFRELGSEDVTVYQNEKKTPRTHQYNSTTKTAGATLTVRPPFKQFSVTVIAYSTTDLTEPLQVITLGSYHLSADSAGSTHNIDVRNYDLSTASDMCTWKQRVVLWGVRGASNLVFVSDPNNPTYFPYPNNGHIFEESVVACVPYLGDLLVFTENKMYRMTWAADGMSFTVDMIQDRLFMSEFDKETITIVQNMVFFKNGNYFYMVVPRKSSAEPGALQLAPISNPITNLLDNFQQEVARLFDQVYNPTNGDRFPPLNSTTKRRIRLHDYYNYLDSTAVRNVYKYQLVDVHRETGEYIRTLLYFDFVLNYDTMSRSWTSYFMQSNGTRLWPYRQNVTDTTVYVNTLNTPTQITVEEGGEVVDVYAGYETVCSFIKPNVLSPKDDFPLARDTLVQERLIKNFQLLDTGYREHASQYKKRYREVQFKINNIDQKALLFGTEFMVDDHMRKEMYDYVTRHVIDPESEDMGYLYVEKVPHDPLVSPGASVLAPDDGGDPPHIQGTTAIASGEIVLQSNYWVLDISQLSKVATTKIRFRVSGKGYAPRMVLLSYNDHAYELLSHNWVYRTMNAR